jgi:hypothetical protein
MIEKKKVKDFIDEQQLRPTWAICRDYAGLSDDSRFSGPEVDVTTIEDVSSGS